MWIPRILGLGVLGSPSNIIIDLSYNEHECDMRELSKTSDPHTSASNEDAADRKIELVTQNAVPEKLVKFYVTLSCKDVDIELNFVSFH